MPGEVKVFSRIRSLSPLWARRGMRRAVSLIRPFERRIDRGVYGDTARLLRRSEKWSCDELASFQADRLRELVRHCEQNIPYYRAVFRETGIGHGDMKDPADLVRLPFMDKESVRVHLDELFAGNLPPESRYQETTGGTSGRPLIFFSEKGFSNQRELAFWHALIRRAGYRVGDLLAVLRNDALPGGRLFLFNPMTRQLLLDPFKLCPENAHIYVDAIRRHRARFLHAYPSSASTLLKFCEEGGLDPGGLIDAVLAGSENVYEGQRERIEKGFGARFFSWYGHSEKLVLAGECEFSDGYHSFPEYGVLELIDDEGRRISEPGVRGEIVGTGFNNRVMPLLRYRTGDFAEWAADQDCPCGRHHPIIVRVAGRWLQEMVLGRSGSRISITSINMHTDAFERVRKFQFLQEEQGRLVLNIVRNEGYSENDTTGIRAAILGKVREELDLEVRFVEDIAATGRGKHRFLIQKLHLGEAVSP